MEFEQYDNPGKFYDMLKHLKITNIIENELMLGLTHLLILDPNHFDIPPFLATIKDHNKVILCAFMTPPWSILVHGVSSLDNRPFQVLIEHLVEEKIKVPGVNGESEFSEKFAEIWCYKTKCQKRLHMASRLYVLKEVYLVKYTPGQLKKAEMDYLDLLIKWTKKFHKEVKLGVKEEYIKNHVKFIIETGNAFIWFDEQPVCMVFFERPHEDGVSIGYVYTPAEFRNKGYATSCVSSVSKHALDSGYSYCSLFADLANPTSNNIYQRVGYQPVCDYIYYDFK